MRKISILLLCIAVVSCQFKSYKKLDDGIEVRIKSPQSNSAQKVRFKVVNDNIIRVTSSASDTFSSVESLIAVPNDQSKVKWSVNNTDSSVSISTGTITASVSLTTGLVSFYDKEGKSIMKEAGLKSLVAIDDAGRKKYRVVQQFDSPSDEAIYGLGQHQYNILNYKNHDIDLYQYNTKVSLPYLLSSRNFGILWDNYSLTKFGDTADYKNITSLLLSTPEGEKGGLKAQYINKSNKSQVFVTRTEQEINYEFLDQQGNMPKEAKMENCLVQWTGTIASEAAGIHKFRFYFAGFAKVWIDNELLVDRWRQCWNPTTSLFEINMEAGRKYNVRIEWDPDGGESYVSLKYHGPQRIDDNFITLSSQIANQIDYYFVKGNNIDELISGYRQITGKASIMPKWAMGLWQSRERYKTQEEIIGTVQEFRKRSIPLDNIVLDWQYWKLDDWGSHDFDTTRFPNAVEMMNDLHRKLNAKLMISVWPKFYEGIDHYKEMDNKGFLYKLNIEKKRIDWIGYVSTFYDAFNPQARELFWQRMNEKLFSKGIDGWWLDASEPDICSNLSIKERQELMSPTALGSGAEFFNAFPLQNAKGVYEGQRSVSPDQRVFILTRSAFSGQQRYAAATWSGDIGSRWEEMQLQIPAALNFSMAGIPYWTMDIGGFSVEKRYEKPNASDLEEWRELQTRWVQFGAFCPLFRVHGQFPYREMYNIAPETHPSYKAMLAYDHLRYRLMPYIYSLAGMTYHNDYTIMRALAMDFSADKKVIDLKDQYMFGPSIMVCPVYTYKARNRNVYLPSGSDWYELTSGKMIEGGQEIKADAPISDIPIYVKSGSIIPVGPAIQYTTEKMADTITLFVYEGADATFNLYEDENINYNYEKGAYSIIPIKYNDAQKSLTIGNREGEYQGMLKQRTFKVAVINKKQAKAFDADIKTDNKYLYNGTSITIKLY